ncbi:MAG: NAD-dependent DNA ligase LigA [Clostridium sp.]|nr:NAD-dependent DNA ligase LigA [Clostridium sp.]
MAEQFEQEKARIKELVGILREASLAYYQESREVMSNYEYDKLYDELLELEEKTGIVFANSPTQNVGYEIVSELPKVQHDKPMLSLNKTKSVAELQEWLGGQEGILSWKMDGITIVLTYENGELSRAVTRGNGETGELITGNARAFANIPLKISYTGRLILRGEAIIRYSDFEKINQPIADVDARYKNPRNLCAGSVRQLDPAVTADRSVNFMAFALVEAPDVDFHNSRREQFEWLKKMGFDVVEYHMVTAETLPEEVRAYAEKIEEYDIPSDGLVLLMDDIAYGESLGRTAKFPRNAIAFKWADERETTKLRYIEWSASRTGLINPVAVFDPVELEGTTVSRASVHNISVMEGLDLGEGDTITVYKANMIIPQIAENLTRSGVKNIPAFCPVCGGKTEIRAVNDAKSLYCVNPDCPAKKLKSFILFTSRDAMNITGLSEATLEKLIGIGLIHDYADIFHLSEHEEEITSLEGFGKKSFDKLTETIDRARNTTLPRVIYGLGVAGIGLANAKILCRHFNSALGVMRRAAKEELTEVEGIGEVLADAWTAYFASEKNNVALERLLAEIHIETEAAGAGEDRKSLEGQTFVITGSLEHFSNRKELQDLIESLGGKAAGSVSAKTTALINNDTQSSSAKNKKAKELGIPILSEEDFLRMIEEGEKQNADKSTE